MDFNTGGSGGQNPNDPSRPLFGGESPRSSPSPAGGPGCGPTGGPGGEFTLSDPVGSFVNTIRNVLLNPVGFFRGIARRGDFAGPLVFALICAVINGVLTGILGLLISLVAGNGFGAAVGSLLAGVIGVPIATAIGLFVGAGIFHLLVLLLVRPSNAGFEATFRVVAYSSATQVLSWLSAIPILGILVSLVVGAYGIYLGVVGIREVHATTTGRAALVVLIPAAVLFLIAILLVGAAALVIFGSQQ
jgi:hypothetical protein